MTRVRVADATSSQLVPQNKCDRRCFEHGHCINVDHDVTRAQRGGEKKSPSLKTEAAERLLRRTSSLIGSHALLKALPSLFHMLMFVLPCRRKTRQRRRSCSSQVGSCFAFLFLIGVTSVTQHKVKVSGSLLY